MININDNLQGYIQQIVIKITDKFLDMIKQDNDSEEFSKIKPLTNNDLNKRYKI